MVRELSVNEAAEILGITTRAVRMRIESRKLAAVKIGGHYTVLMDENEPMLIAHETRLGSNAENCAPGEVREVLPTSVVRNWADATIGAVARLSQENGILTQQLEEMTRERDALLALLDEERAPPAVGLLAWLRGLRHA
jgi:excisionase family DNA binding protein